MGKLPPGIEKRGDGSYRLTVSKGYENGVQQRYRKTIELPGGMSERAQIAEAVRQRALFLAEVERGETTNARQITVEGFSREWMDSDVNTRGLSPVTISNYQRMLRDHIIPGLGAVKLHRLTPLTLTKFYNALAKKDSARGGTISARYVRNVHGVLRTMLNVAVRWGYISRNPADAANVPRSDTQEPAIYDDGQCAALLEALEAAPYQYRCAVTLALFSQMRKGELAGLDWPCIDFDRSTCEVKQSAVYIAGQGVVLKAPKTKAGNRTISIPSSIMGMFRELKRQQAEARLKLGEAWHDSGAVFVGWDGQRIHPDTIPKWFADFLKANELPYIRFHALRHTGASILIDAGEKPMNISRRLGHVDLSTTLKIYALPLRSAIHQPPTRWRHV